MILALVLALVAGVPIWLALVGSFGGLQLTGGVMVVLSGWAVAVRLTGMSTGWSVKGVLPSLYHLLRYFLACILPSALKSVWKIVRLSFAPRQACRPVIVAVKLEGMLPQAAFLLSFAVSISPGDQVVDFDLPSGILFIHTVGVSDPDAFRRGIRKQYETYVREIVK